ncbi:MAG: hypothetical protein M1814_004314 [Vezdaea aestivalis]|nr:MAG: hypothetical protein M1814_004314 [Vezdaea aestivalis]
MASPPPAQLPSEDIGNSKPILSVDGNTEPKSLAESNKPAPALRLPSLKSLGSSPMSLPSQSSAAPLSALNAARRPLIPQGSGPTPGIQRMGSLPQDMQAKMMAFHRSRQRAPTTPGTITPGVTSPNTVGTPVETANVEAVLPDLTKGLTITPSVAGSCGPSGSLSGTQLAPTGRPQAHNWVSSPVVQASKSPKPSLGARRGLKLPGGLPGASPVATPGQTPPLSSAPGAVKGPGPLPSSDSGSDQTGSLFNKFSKFVDTKTGTLKFAGKAVIHGKGIDFSSGSSFSISLDEVDNLEELGKGNYGTVYRVRHSRPQVRRPGLGLQGNKAPPSIPTTDIGSTLASNPTETSSPSTPTEASPTANLNADGTTGIIMAMKEVRLELDEAKFAAIIMELDILHRCISPFIVDFYGAFFQEGAVYICMEFMDGGSIDKLYGDGTPEGVLRKITLSAVMGLKCLKEDHNIIHRDVKPTNILVNTKGQVKICDFGVSGNLVASIAKTNIGCQSYMAPERIASGGMAQSGASSSGTYSVQSDIWSLGLTIIECALGRYPYPPETFNNIFSQLSAIVDDEPPNLPDEGYSDQARDFVRRCLNKAPNLRPTYAMLLRSEWLKQLLLPPSNQDAAAHVPPKSDLPDTYDEEVATWVLNALERKKCGKMGKSEKPALHAAPLDAVSSPSKV